MKSYGILLVALATIAPIRSRVVQDYTTPTPILKQINKQNEDGSYSYGYEGADGTFKIETKYPNGEVYGKYGYIDDQGKPREVEYGATRRGFEPAGSEISVPPPTLEQNPKASRPLDPNEEDDGQYREDPSVYYKDEKYSRDPPPRPQNSWNNPRLNSWNQQTPNRFDDFDNFIFNNPTTTPRPYYPPPPPPQAPRTYNPPPTPPPYNPPAPYNPRPYTPPNYNNYNNYYPQNPYVPNIDYYTGSYTVNYR